MAYDEHYYDPNAPAYWDQIGATGPNYATSPHRLHDDHKISHADAVRALFRTWWIWAVSSGALVLIPVVWMAIAGNTPLEVSLTVILGLIALGTPIAFVVKLLTRPPRP